MYKPLMKAQPHDPLNPSRDRQGALKHWRTPFPVMTRTPRHDGKGRVLLVLFLCLVATTTLPAQDLGTMGPTYPIIEMDFLEWIHSRIEAWQRGGKWQALQQHLQEKAAHDRDRPQRVPGITRALQTKSWTMDPTLLLTQAITTPDGQVIAPAGTRVNPLQYRPLSHTLIFYDGDDPDQVRWALAQSHHFKKNLHALLVNGSLLSQEKALHRPLYFDQGGRLTTHFGITHVPARVQQEGLVLRITEERP